MYNVITRESDFFTDLFSKINTMENAVDRTNESNVYSGKRWMNGEEVMNDLGISKRTLQTYRDNGILPYSIVLGKFFYSGRDIEDLMANNYVAARK